MITSGKFTSVFTNILTEKPTTEYTLFDLLHNKNLWDDNNSHIPYWKFVFHRSKFAGDLFLEANQPFPNLSSSLFSPLHQIERVITKSATDPCRIFMVANKGRICSSALCTSKEEPNSGHKGNLML